MYKVIKYFTDLQDNNFAYHEGDIFPRNGKIVSDERLAELSSNSNKRGIKLIEKINEVETPTEVVSPEKEFVDDFMNPPEIAEEVEEKPKKKRGRPKNAE